MNYKSLKKVKVELKDFQLYIDRINDLLEAGCPLVRGTPTTKPIDTEYYIWQTSSNLHVCGRFLTGVRPAHLVFNTMGLEEYEADVPTYYREFLRFVDKTKINTIDESVQDVFDLTASPYMYKNDAYEGKEIENCTCYDVNKAYLAACRNDMPDTSKELGSGMVEEDELGFLPTGKVIQHRNKHTEYAQMRDQIKLCMPGEFAWYRFKKMPSPLLKWVDYKIEQLNDPNRDKHITKESIVCSIGNLQNHNPFIRAAIMGHAENFIRQYKDENTIYCNTDSIVSLTERPDLPLSDKVGDFKVEAKGTFMFYGWDYTWSTGKSAKRGFHKLKEDIITFDWDRKEIKWVKTN